MTVIHNNRLSAIGSIVLALSVALGALGAHALRDLIDSSTMETYKTAVHYAQLHGLALVFLPLIQGSFNPTLIVRIWRMIALGIFLFSGSLIGLVIARANGANWDMLGAITPLGGVLWIVSWGLLAWFLMRRS
ncbi:MAG: DUF423 domain-containing protein [Flavobacteriales bacterium]|nr:DUF423 domain-containing protein [Flavobacteriales bacterium]